MLKPSAPGALIRQGGDIDNQLKMLFDALRQPQNAQEIPHGLVPGDGETPFVCLLDDDEKIAKLTVAVDRYLARPNERDVHVTIFVKTRPTKTAWRNLPLT